MPLHRDIHWLGRQWAVTGHGLQLINQKQMGYYDIEIARLWEPRVIESMRAKAWINRDDFDKAIEIAQARFADTAPSGAEFARSVVSPPPASATPVPIATPAAPTIEELLAQLKLRSAIAKPVEPVPDIAAEPERAAPSSQEPLRAPIDVPPPVEAIAPADQRLPSWPVFERKIAGRGRLVKPWRARFKTRHSNLPGLPPRA